MVLQGKTKFWGNSYTYDAWGNRLHKDVTKCGAEYLNVTADAHNWLHASTPDYTYDAAGNMIFNATPPTQNYTWDEENRLTGAAGYTYTYDGDGNRVRKSNGNAAANGTLYWSMTPGVVSETDLAGTIKSEYIFFDGERVARRDGPTGAGGVFYYFSDHLKTASVITDAAGVIKAESDYYPWGGELKFVDNDINDYKFTGKKRDIETRLDYFGARYYANELGRWVSADWSATPVPVPYASFGDPQTLNLYGYVGGNPASKADADGHICPSCVWAARAAEWFRGVSKDVKIGAAKGVGGLAVDMLRGSGNIVTPGAPQLGARLTTHLTNLMMPKEVDKALQPSNKTQASAAKATKITLTALSLVAGAWSIRSALAAETTAMTEGTLFRAGGTNPGNITGENLSFRDSLSNPIESKSNPVFKPGKGWFSTDVSKLPEGAAVRDGGTNGLPEGHVTVNATPQAIKSASEGMPKGKFPR